MLLGKEIRKTVLSLTFVAFIIALLVTTISQDVLNFSDEAIASPKQGADYGIQQKEVPELIMPAAFSSLCEEFAANESEWERMVAARMYHDKARATIRNILSRYSPENSRFDAFFVPHTKGSKISYELVDAKFDGR